LKKLLLALGLSVVVLGAVSCSKKTTETNNETKANVTESVKGDNMGAVTNITAKEAKEIMDSQTGYIILDVRSEEEYKEGHVPYAKSLPLDVLESKAAEELPDKEQQILVYCRSGNRSTKAAGILEKLGYTNIKNFGGIKDWTYDIEK
jgi:putative lipoprotein